jgi:hypothetical protein
VCSLGVLFNIVLWFGARVCCRCGLHGRCVIDGSMFQHSLPFGACVLGCRWGLHGSCGPVVSIYLGACVVGCRCGLHGRCGFARSTFQHSRLGVACVVGCRCGLDGSIFRHSLVVWVSHVLLVFAVGSKVAVGSRGGYFSGLPPCWGMCCRLSLWAPPRPLWVRGWYFSK